MEIMWGKVEIALGWKRRRGGVTGCIMKVEVQGVRVGGMRIEGVQGV